MNSTNAEFLARLNCLWHFMSAVDLQSIDELCRLCMSKEDGLIPIFYKSSFLSNWILDCTSIKVAMGDGLPSRICQQCHEQLRHWAEFRQRCQEINVTLQGCLDKTKLQNIGKMVSESNEDAKSITSKGDRSQLNDDGVNDDENQEDDSILKKDRLAADSSKESNGTDNSMQELPKKNGILTKTDVLGNKKNTQTNNDESSQEQEKPRDSYTCNKCGKEFGTKDELHDHEEVHSETQTFPCILCGKTFLKKKYFEIHMRHHTGNKTHMCGTCGREFGNRTKMTVHMRIHTGEKPYACTLCTKTFRHKKSLSKHSYTHSKEKPFKCSECKRGFSDKWHLTQHFRLHTGEKPYRCTLCGQRFTHNVSLKDHMRHHTGEMWHCDACPKKYTTKSSLTAHFRNVHKE